MVDRNESQSSSLVLNIDLCQDKTMEIEGTPLPSPANPPPTQRSFSDSQEELDNPDSARTTPAVAPSVIGLSEDRITKFCSRIERHRLRKRQSFHSHDLLFLSSSPSPHSKQSFTFSLNSFPNAKESTYSEGLVSDAKQIQSSASSLTSSSSSSSLSTTTTSSSAAPPSTTPFTLPPIAINTPNRSRMRSKRSSFPKWIGVQAIKAPERVWQQIEEWFQHRYGYSTDRFDGLGKSIAEKGCDSTNEETIHLIGEKLEALAKQMGWKRMDLRSLQRRVQTTCTQLDPLVVVTRATCQEHKEWIMEKGSSAWLEIPSQYYHDVTSLYAYLDTWMDSIR